MTKYQVRVQGSPMEIVGAPMWKGVWFDTREEAEAALEKARQEIRETWANPMLNEKGETTIPVWVEGFDEKYIRPRVRRSGEAGAND